MGLLKFSNPKRGQDFDKMYISVLCKKSGLPAGEIKTIIIKHFGSDIDKQLNKEEFLIAYEDLVLGNLSNADALTSLIFTAFDNNGDKLISLKEFLVGFDFKY